MNTLPHTRGGPPSGLTTLRRPMLALWLLLLACGTAVAQNVSDDRRTEWVQVQVTVSFLMPGQTAYGSASLTAQAQARQAIYEVAAHECDLLRAAIADECRSESFNVSVNPNYGQGEALASGNFNLRIRLK